VNCDKLIPNNFNIYQINLSTQMITKLKIIIVLLISVQFAVNSFAQKKSADNNVLVVTTIKHLEKNIVTADERIIRYESEIVL